MADSKKRNEAFHSKTGSEEKARLTGSSQMFSAVKISAARMNGHLGLGVGIQKSPPFWKERSSLTDRLTSILWSLVMLYTHYFPDVLKTKVSAQTNESSTGVPDDEESHFLYKKKDEEISEVKKLLETPTAIDDETDDTWQRICLERNVSEELTREIKGLSTENSHMMQQMDFVKHAHAKSLRLLRAFLDDFIELCFRVLLTKTGSLLHQFFGDFKNKFGHFWGNHLSAVDVDTNDDTLDNEDDEQNDAASDRTEVNGDIIKNLRKTKEIKLKLKQLEEELPKEKAIREIVETDKRKKIGHLQQSAKEQKGLWSDSSHWVAESVRVFVEHLETVGLEILTKKVQNEEQIEELRQTVGGYRKMMQKLVGEVDWLRKQASKEATAAIEKKREKLKDENESLVETVTKLEKTLRKTEEARERAKEEYTLKAEEVGQLASENTTLKSAQNERKIWEFERKVATYKAQLKKEQSFSMAMHSPPNAGLVQRNPGRLSASFQKNDPMTQSLPYKGTGSEAMSTSFSAYGRDRPSDSGVGQSLAGRNGRIGNSSLAGPMGSQKAARPSQQLMQCLKCSIQFLVSETEDYERHIRQCYGIGVQ
eukprot:m.84413 g.84413  ORF g.84413 m.84413 type:complete len:594 (+) comp36409_c0_seq16:1041-2822(+)